MRTERRESGISMVETTIVVAIVAALTALSMPAVRSFFKSLGPHPED